MNAARPGTVRVMNTFGSTIVCSTTSTKTCHCKCNRNRKQATAHADLMCSRRAPLVVVMLCSRYGCRLLFLSSNDPQSAVPISKRLDA